MVKRRFDRRVAITNNEIPWQIHSGGEKSIVFQHFNTSARRKHYDDFGLIQYVSGRVNGYAVECLELQTRSIEVNPSSIGKHVEPVPPLCVPRPQSDLDHGRREVPSRNNRRQLRGRNVAVDVPRHLFESPLNVERQSGVIDARQDKLPHAVEGVVEIVESDDVRVSED